MKIINDNLINLEGFHVFSSAMSYSRYHPSKGYSWEFSEKEEPGLCFKLHIISKLFVLPCLSERRIQFDILFWLIRKVFFSHSSYFVTEKKESSDKKKKEEPSSFFQRQRVDNLLGELAKKFPPKVVQPIHTEVKGIGIIIFNFRGGYY